MEDAVAACRRGRYVKLIVTQLYIAVYMNNIGYVLMKLRR